MCVGHTHIVDAHFQTTKILSLVRHILPNKSIIIKTVIQLWKLI